MVTIWTIILTVAWICLGTWIWHKFDARFRPKTLPWIVPYLGVFGWPAVLIYWVVVETIFDEGGF